MVGHITRNNKGGFGSVVLPCYQIAFHSFRCGLFVVPLVAPVKQFDLVSFTFR